MNQLQIYMILMDYKQSFQSKECSVDKTEPCVIDKECIKDYRTDFIGEAIPDHNKWVLLKFVSSDPKQIYAVRHALSYWDENNNPKSPQYKKIKLVVTYEDVYHNHDFDEVIEDFHTYQSDFY